MKKFLVLGSTGMVGSSIIRALELENVDILKPTKKELNLLNKDNVRYYLENNRPDIIINAAGKVGGIRENILKDKEFLFENISMGLNVVESAYNLKIKSYLNFASSCIYTTNKTIHSEDDIDFEYFEPTNWGYAFAKASILKICQKINQDPSFSYKTVVPCNLFGINDNFNADSSHLIPAIIHKLHDAKVNNLDEVVIWGDGSAKREFLYTEELSRLIMLYIKDFNSMPEILNIGTGKSISVFQYYELIASLVGYMGRFTFDKSKPNGIAKKELDITKMKKLGWTIDLSLEDSIKETYQFYKEQK